MLKRLLPRLALFIVALFLVVGVLMTVLRDPAAGGYDFATRFEHKNGDAAGDLAVVAQRLPLVRLYGASGESPLSIVLVPVFKLGVPLGWPAPLLRYDIADDGTLTLRNASSPEPTRYLSPLKEAETARRFQAWKKAHEQRKKELRELANVAPSENGWVGRLGVDAATLILPDDYIYRGGGIESIDINKDVHMQLEAAHGRPAPDLDRQFSRRFVDFARTDDDVFAARNEDGRFIVEAVRKLEDETWALTGTADDFDAAASLVAIARSVRDGGQPWRIVGANTDYMRSPVLQAFPHYQAEANAAITDWLSRKLKPEIVVLDLPFMEESIRLDGENDEGSRIFNLLSIRLTLGDKDERPEGSEVLARSTDQPVSIHTVPGTDYTLPECVAEGVFPLLQADDDKTLFAKLDLASPSLPECRLAAALLVDFGRSGFADTLDLEAIAPLSDYFGGFNSAEPGADGLMILKDDKTGTVIRRTGEVVIPPADDTAFSFLGDRALMGNNTAGSGIALYDLDGTQQAALDYDYLSEVMAPQDVWGDIFETARDGAYGLYDLSEGREIAPARYDRFRFYTDLQLILAYRGEVADLLTRDGGSVIPGGVSDHVFVDTAPAPPPEDGFLAVKATSDGTWQFVTRNNVPLLDGRFADVRRVPSASGYAFELTGLDGNKRSIVLTDKGKVEAVPAPR